MNGLPSTREQAVAEGAARYCTGVPCVNGHEADRLASNGNCTVCRRAVMKNWRLRNVEKSRQDAKRYRQEHPEWTRHHRSAWRAANPEKMAAYRKAWVERNIDAKRAGNRRWARENPEKFKAASRRRRARLRNAEGSYTASDLWRIRLAQRDRCACCRIKLRGKGQEDHITPLAKGGSNRASNIQLLCQPCNQAKHDRDAVDFMQSRGFLL